MTDVLEGLSILAVEDNALNETTLALLLRRYKASYQCIRTGFGVVQAALNLDRIDLILLDIGLPHQDGYTVLQQIRAEKRLEGVKVVAVSARDPRTEIERAQKAGFDGYIAKPLRQNLFADQLRRIMAGEAVWDAGG